MHDATSTQQFSSWGDKLLGHTDVLYLAQVHRQWKPINIQLAPTEICESNCSFCSVANRPTCIMAWPTVVQCLTDFKSLGAKALEITGGGNPLLYRHTGRTINDLVIVASKLGYDIGVITNSHSLKILKPDIYQHISWIRVSLFSLDSGIAPEQYDFNGFPLGRLGFSYIVHGGTTDKSVEQIVRLTQMHPQVKFVRVAGDCLVKGNNVRVFQTWRNKFEAADTLHKVFFKNIGEGGDDPFNDGCYVGMVRPYIAPDPSGKGYNVYICSSHVLNDRTYDRNYALCPVENIVETWRILNHRFKHNGFPYEVRSNGGANWRSTCKYCFYKNNNSLLHTICHDLPDKNFA